MSMRSCVVLCNYEYLAGFVLKKHKKMLEEKKDEISLEELIEKEVFSSLKYFELFASTSF